MSKALSDTFILPDWPAPTRVKAIQTTRLGGVSQSPYDSLNLGTHVNDAPQHVARNRQLLSTFVPTEPVWLNQTHSTIVIDAAKSRCIEDADASFTTQPAVVCAVMTADCLPVLLCDRQGSVVAAIHAGWRGLCDGVIEEAVKSMPVDSSELMAWLGPAIGPDAFEVDNDVRQQFVHYDQQSQQAFRAQGKKWLGDLFTIAKQRLQNVGVDAVYTEKQCTYTDAAHFFSYRRDVQTGRMATMIWLQN